jgi:hypothetical protein
MKKYLLIFLAIPLLAMECKYRKFEFAPTINIDETYVVDENGPYSEQQTITREQVLDALDIPETANIKEFNIEKMALQVTVLDGNEASLILASGRLQLGSSKPKVFEDFPVSLVAVNAYWIGLNSLIAECVDALTDKIEAYILNKDTAPLNIEIYGDSSPTGGQKVNVKLQLKITGTVKYEDCIETLSIIGDDCDI